MSKDEACDVVPVHYYWGAVGYHRLSAFGQFPYPPAPSRQRRDPRPISDPSVPRARLEQLVDGTLRDAWRARASTRTYCGEPVPLDVLGGLLWFSYGFSRGEFGRAVPSAGSTYALRLRIAALRVEGLAPGVYDVEFAVDGIGWRRRSSVDPQALPRWFVTQHVDYATAAAVVVMVGHVAGAAAYYGERAYRMLHLEAGHVGQNLSLAAAARRLEHVCIAGFDDEIAEPALGIDDPSELLVYGVVLGGGRPS